MLKTYQEDLILRTCHCDFQGTWRPSAILEAMQEAAGAHTHLLGCGRDVLIKRNTAWVLSRSEIHMEEYPRILDRVTVETIPMPNRRWFFPRYFLFKNEEGRILGHAGTLWALLDIQTRKMLPPGEVAHLIPDNSDLSVPMGLPATVDAVSGEEQLISRTPFYTDLDVNQHVNNTRYADWACDALGIDTMRDYCLESLLINYHAEILPRQEIALRVTRNGLNYHVAGYEGDKMHFELGGRLMPRKG